MAYQIILKPSALKELKKLENKDQNKIFRALNHLSLDPYSGKKLSGKYEDFYSIRVWPFRIIYTIVKKEKTIVITKIGHRQGVYL